MEVREGDGRTGQGSLIPFQKKFTLGIVTVRPYINFHDAEGCVRVLSHRENGNNEDVDQSEQ